jgi:Protein of unknown function (DUF3667)
MATHLESIKIENIVAQPEHCPNCGTILTGKYCHNCGQKRIKNHDFALKHFFGHVVHEFTHLDSNKVINTLISLMFRPGLLTDEYLAGRKGHYINPIRVYLTISFLYFLFGWGPLLQVGGGAANNLVSQEWFVTMANQRGIEPHALAERIDQKREKYVSGMRFVGVLLSGAFLTFLYYGKRKYYVEHLIFSLHFYSFDFLMRCVLAVLFLGFNKIGILFYTPARVFFYLIIFVYILLAVRRVYKETWVKTVSKSVVLFAGETALFILIVVMGTYIAFSIA